MRVERDLSSTLIPHSMGGIEVSFASGSVLKNRLSIGSFDGFRKYTFIPGGRPDESVSLGSKIEKSCATPRPSFCHF